jgi:tetratricopeptide (TPR) repeat protein
MRIRHHLMGILVAAIVLGSTLTPAVAQVTETPFDLEEYKAQINELGVPTMSSVKAIKDQASAAFEDGQYEAAIPLLQQWARKANWLANIINAGLEPFYNASYDDTKNFPFDRITMLLVYETAANSLKRDRNHAMIMEAECLVALGRPDEAVSLYMKALDLVNVNDWDWWVRAANGLYAIVEVPPLGSASGK